MKDSLFQLRPSIYLIDGIFHIIAKKLINKQLKVLLSSHIMHRTVNLANHMVEND